MKHSPVIVPTRSPNPPRHFTIGTMLASLACLTLAAPATAQDARVFTEWTVPTPNSEPLLALPVGEDSAYFTERVASKIGQLDIHANTISEWSLPQPLADPHELIRVGGRLFFAEQGNIVAGTGAIGGFDPATGNLTEWIINSTPFPVPEHVVRIGNFFYFTESYADRIGRLDPRTNAVVEWPLPFGGGGFNLNGLEVEGNGTLWLVEVLAHLVARFDLATQTLTEWPLPVAPFTLNHVYLQEHMVYLTDGGGTAIMRLDPATNIIKLWTDPTASAGVTGLSLREIAELPAEASEPVNAYFGEFTGNNIGRFITTVAPSTDNSETPVTTLLVPVASTATVVTSTLTKTVTPVVPVTTVVPAVVNGAFEFWPIPTSSAGFGEFAKLEEGGLLFTERTGNKVALFARPEESAKVTGPR